MRHVREHLSDPEANFRFAESTQRKFFPANGDYFVRCSMIDVDGRVNT
jgi:hypothetical protein